MTERRSDERWVSLRLAMRCNRTSLYVLYDMLCRMGVLREINTIALVCVLCFDVEALLGGNLN